MPPGASSDTLVELNDMMNEMINLNPCVIFMRSADVNDVLLNTFTDSGLNNYISRNYGRTCTVIGLIIIIETFLDTFHPIDWCINNPILVSYYSCRAKILAFADGDDKFRYLNT